MTRYLQATIIFLAATGAARAEPVEIPPIVVTASRLDQPGYSVGSAMTVISGDQLEQRQIRFVGDALRAVPGLAVSRSGPAGAQTQVRIRGAEANMTLVLIDGVKINDPGTDDSVDLSNLMALNVERIEVLRGAQSVLWGSSASGGVINIITRKGAGTPHLRLSAEGGSFGTTQYDGNLSGGGTRYTYSLGGSRYDTHNVSSAKNGAESDPFRQGTIYGRATVTPIDALTFAVSGHTVHGRTEYDHPPVDDNSSADTVQSFGQASATLRLFDDHFENILQGSLLRTRSESFDDAFGFVGASEGNKRVLSNQANIFWDTKAALPLAHRITFLIENEHSRGNVSFAPSGVFATLGNTGYAGEYGVNYDERVFLTGGVRYDDNTNFKNATTYRVTAAWRLLRSGTRLHTSYGTGVKNPTLVELFGYAGLFTGNPDLKPEATTSIDFGVEQSFLADRFTVDVTAFHNKITDFIQSGATSSINLAGETRINGLEVALSGRLTQALSLDVSYTALDAQSEQGAELLRRPRNSGGIAVNYESADAATNVNLAVNYNGRARDQAFNGPFDFTGALVDLEPYTLVTLSASHMLCPHVTLHARLENLLDQEYEDLRYYGNPGLAAFAGITFDLGT